MPLLFFNISLLIVYCFPHFDNCIYFNYFLFVLFVLFYLFNFAIYASNLVWYLRIVMIYSFNFIFLIQEKRCVVKSSYKLGIVIIILKPFTWHFFLIENRYLIGFTYNLFNSTNYLHNTFIILFWAVFLIFSWCNCDAF